MKRCSILLAAFVGLLSVAQAIPTDGLVALYNFEGNAVDQSGNANNATAQGSFNYVAGRTGTGIRLNGDGSLFYAGGGYVALPQFSSALNDGITLSLWAKDELIGGNPVGEE